MSRINHRLSQLEASIPEPTRVERLREALRLLKAGLPLPDDLFRFAFRPKQYNPTRVYDILDPTLTLEEKKHEVWRHAILEGRVGVNA
jgi:hypothetical protein